ncbi:MAG: hypothetical protein GWO11_05655, partial [Desulfuromonadales bacterium]|nr:hypothetical protein [Desulfuromonadales bacterium]NIR33875.1 hypothetical protein [Desulfuromonadales bacterium]NIS40026.1 hypothetical protein [Desulfuromonadales bacterium]
MRLLIRAFPVAMVLLSFNPAPTFCAMEYQFIYFPHRTIEATPAAYGLDFEEVRFEAADGTALHGWLVAGEEQQPLVLFCHG